MNNPKFRAWDDKNKKWLLGYDYPNLGGFSMFGETMAFGEYAEMLNSFSLEDWDCIKLMQFTGLFDKNNKEIYADDLLQDNKGVVFRVYSTYGGFVIKADWWMKDCSDLVPPDELIYEPLADPQNASWIRATAKVVGNIYENPELLINKQQ